MFINFNLLLPTMPVFVCWVQNTKIYKDTFKVAFTIVMAIINILPASAQSVTNGNFNSTTSGWGCNPEATYRESTYGGSSSSNRVAEVDQQAGLCQTISGFTIGHEYELSFKCSRRTTCGPTLQTMDVIIDGGVLTESISRNGGAFNFTTENFTFVASATSHTLTFDGTVSGTCGLIVDDIEVNFVSALPVELLHFDAKLNDNNQVDLSWSTAMELNNDYFTVERSMDGLNWAEVEQIIGAGNSNTVLAYQTTDLTPMNGLSYYRLKQTDFDGTYSYSSISAVKMDKERATSLTVYPNPATTHITIVNVVNETDVHITNALGQDLTQVVRIEKQYAVNQIKIDLTSLSTGMYYISTNNGTTTINKK